MALFRFVWQFLQLAQFDQLGELVAVVFVDQLGELVRLLGLLVADNRAHVRPAFRPSPSGQRQTTHLQRHSATHQAQAHSGAFSHPTDFKSDSRTFSKKPEKPLQKIKARYKFRIDFHGYTIHVATM